MSGNAQITVVIATMNRREGLLATLDRLRGLPERPPVIVVDNGSADGTAAAVRARFPDVVVKALDHNAGAAARNIGVAEAGTTYVAFSDDDSWWEPGSLARAVAAFDADPRLGLVAARTVVGPDRAEDPINRAMADSPLRTADGPEVLGFLACGSVVRRSAFLEVGGFSPLLFFVGEERLLAYDLAAAGWDRRYLPEVVAVHEPSSLRPPSRRRHRAERRNSVLTAWLRRPMPVAVAETTRLTADALGNADDRAALAGLVRRLPVALLRRRPLPPDLERKVVVLEEVR